ncbi:DEAD/DEAH box helicase [Mucilaginibacter terrae]|uniref:Superfamily II DNA or RNA helicase n=1 Tax=Mucilaginibacter terrae TaxID=1955052 RepID=A0ABU3H023_9SPHI|nr:DEAD/DEAH box helicase [Mucilaginibacter terrae]MDT3405368.1 superfamily II DNA or RNA helicase [Mucilaginibacter terrae]
MIECNTQLYDYQRNDLNKLFTKMEQVSNTYKLLYQLPTGGGKTVIFSEIANQFILKYKQNVMILTHRQELCNQTSITLKKCGIVNKVINSQVKRVKKTNEFKCYVAMVETLKNRIETGDINIDDIGLLIIDEAHHNSFQKLIDKFANARVIGVTATPYSSDASLPMYKTYDELIIGESIESLIENGFLAAPTTWRYDVELNTLQTGTHGDFTTTTSDELYASPAMLELLLHAYEEHSKNKKVLIFNNGIFASKAVCQMFNDAGYPAKHLDNETTATERADILLWLKKTKNAILTSVSILTTGFDEPTIQTVILNRATTSLTLYHQMIGRGSRRLPKKKTFTIIDLGNNVDRFGQWNAAVDWQFVFDHPDAYNESIQIHSSHDSHKMPSEMRSMFPNTLEIAFDVQQAYHEAIEAGRKPSTIIAASIDQHAQMCTDNSDTIAEALALAAQLETEVTWRVKQYGKCLGKATKNYLEWLQEDYKSKLEEQIKDVMAQRLTQKIAV